MISVEHDPDWHEAVQKAVIRAGFPGGEPEIHLVAGDSIEPAAEGGPPASGVAPSRGPALSYRSDRLPGLSFQRYASFIDRFERGAFDLVVVDGRARASCIAHAIPRVRAGGWLLLDNAERRRYAAAREMLAQYPRFDLRGLGPWAPTPWLTTAWRIV